MKKQTIIAAAYLSLIPILIVDRITPLGYAEWVLYIIPTIVIALVAGRKSSVLFAGICSGLMMLGVYLSPPSILPLRVAIYNRAIGIITLWSAMLLMRLYGRARVEISKLAEAKEELMWEKDLLQNVMNAAGKSHFVYLDRDFNFVRVNETYAKTCGYKPEEMIGKNHFDLYPHAENEAIFARVRDTGIAEEYHDKPFVFPDQPERGTTYWDWTLTPVKDDAGTVLGLVFSLTETTERKRSEEQLEAHRGLLEAVVNNVPAAVNLIRGSDLRVQFINPAYQAIAPDKEMRGKTLDELWPETGQNFTRICRRVLETGEPYHAEDELNIIRRSAEGPPEEAYFTWSFHRVRLPGHEGWGILNTAWETTERKTAEALIDRLAALVENAEDAIISKDLNGIILSWNTGAENIFGYTSSEAVGRHISFLVPPGHTDDVPEIIKRISRGEHIERFETERMKKDGTIVPVSLTFSPIKDAHGTVVGISKIAHDITERKRAEEALRQSESNLARAQAIAHLANWEVDIGTNVVRGSQELYRLFELTPGENLDVYTEKFHPDDKQRVMNAINASMHEGKPYGIDYRIVVGSGEIRHVHAEGETIRDSSGQPIKFFGTVQDITERKQAEEALQRSNAKLEASNKELGAFVYSVTHDLRGPLRRIIGFSEILLDEYSGRLDDKGNQHLSKVIKGATKMNEIIEDLLRLSRISRSDVRRQDVDLGKTAGSIVAELRRTHPDRRVTVDVQEALTAHADSGLIEIALLNLLGNAWKFTSKTEDARIELGSFEREGKTVYYVKDNGAGFDQELAKELFEPFSRLHSEQEFEGTGIGLAIVERVIGRHGGKIWAEGKKNEGAVFYFTLN